MFYYEIATGGKTRGSTAIFTYESSYSAKPGTIVEITVRGKKCLGFIVKKVTKPAFKTVSLHIAEPTMELPTEVINTFNDLRLLYPFSESALASLFTPPTIRKIDATSASSSNSKKVAIPPLNTDQQIVIDAIRSSNKNSLLLGDTGTGKTRMYLHLIEPVIKSGKNVLLLAPEIGLASYLYQEVMAYFDDTLLYHSNLTPKNRGLLWQKALATGGGLLAVGPRSALTLPLSNIGLIILDEAHDNSYRQENSPYIHAKIVAALLAKNHGARCVYGTATPSVVDYHNAEKLGNPIVRIDARAVDSDKTSTIKIANYEDTTERTGSSLLKSSLDVISKAIRSGGQALVLVNRRGTARYVACDSCGHEQRCKVCDHLVVYHHDTYELRCHYCDKRYPVPSRCTECGSHEIKMRSFGTKAITDELQRAFPDTTIRRFDTDSSKKDHLLEHTGSLKTGEVQIIVGTQMIAKGLDLPKLKSLVVLTNSTGAGYTSEERDFQLLYQVIGRATRGHQNTQTVIQTSAPDKPGLRFAIQRDYYKFLKHELLDRKKFYYPPYCHMMIVHFKRKSSKSALSAGEKLYADITTGYSGIMASGPVPNMTERIGSEFYWHILVKSPKRSSLLQIAKDIGSSWICEFDPIDTP